MQYWFICAMLLVGISLGFAIGYGYSRDRILKAILKAGSELIDILSEDSKNRKTCELNRHEYEPKLYPRTKITEEEYASIMKNQIFTEKE